MHTHKPPHRRRRKRRATKALSSSARLGPFIRSGLAGLAMLGTGAGAVLATPADPDQGFVTPPDLMSNHSRYIAGLQARFGRLPGVEPIVVLDRDSLVLEAGLRGIDDMDTPAFRALVAMRIEARSGARLTLRNAGHVASYLEHHIPTAWPFSDPERFAPDSPVSRVCVVVPGNPDMSRRDHLFRMLQYYPDVFGPRHGAPVREVMRYRQHLAWTDLHEISHCIDNRWLTGVAGTFDADMVHDIHRSEMFAETLAAIIGFRDGIFVPADIRQRADIRAVSSRITGAFLASHFAASPMYGPEGSGGAIYHLSPALNEVADILEKTGVEAIRAMPLPALVALAQSMVEEHAMNRTDFDAITTYLSAGDSFLENMRRFAEPGSGFDDDMRKTFAARANAVERFKKQTDPALHRLLGQAPDGNFPAPHNPDGRMVRQALEAMDVDTRIKLAEKVTALGNTATAVAEALRDERNRLRDEIRDAPANDIELRKRLAELQRFALDAASFLKPMHVDATPGPANDEGKAGTSTATPDIRDPQRAPK